MKVFNINLKLVSLKAAVKIYPVNSCYMIYIITIRREYLGLSKSRLYSSNNSMWRQKYKI